MRAGGIAHEQGRSGSAWRLLPRRWEGRIIPIRRHLPRRVGRSRGCHGRSFHLALSPGHGRIKAMWRLLPPVLHGRSFRRRSMVAPSSGDSFPPREGVSGSSFPRSWADTTACGGSFLDGVQQLLFWRVGGSRGAWRLLHSSSDSFAGMRAYLVAPSPARRRIRWCVAAPFSQGRAWRLLPTAHVGSNGARRIRRRPR